MNETADNSEEINDESDHDVEERVVGYYTRSKRRKLDNDDEECTSCHREYLERKRKNPIMYVPTEMLQAVFRHLSFHELSQTVRLVNRRFRLIAEDVLNCGFKKIEKQLQTLAKTTEVSLAYTQDDMELKCISKLLNMLEILRMQYAVVISTIWRYVYNEYYKTNKTCMYGGQLIDAHQAFMWKFLHYPSQLYAPAVIRDYALPAEVTKIVQLTKVFCVHFDKVSEEVHPDCLICSGCKILDIIDCANFIQKTTTYEKAGADSFVGQYSYFFRNSWFVALPISVSKDMEWSQKQRMMHMRLRRVVLAHNDMFLQQAQYERELMLRPDPAVRIKKPGNNVYTGYGDVGDVFFYYGVMNDGAYIQKFNTDEDNEEEENDEEFPEREDFDVNANLARNNSEEDIFYRIPHLGFRMNVDVRCPLSYAPMSFLNRMDEEKMQKLKYKHRTKGPSHITISFQCEGASYPRLPTHYEYDFKPKQV